MPLSWDGIKNTYSVQQLFIIINKKLHLLG